MKPLYDVLEATTIRFAIYHLHYKEELWITNIAYNPYLYYSSDKLRTITSIYQLKASFVPSYATQSVKFLLDNQVLLNKQL